LLRCKFGGLQRKRFVEEVTTEGWAISTDGGALAYLRLTNCFCLVGQTPVLTPFPAR
jgi:hypothetical protein